MIFLRKISRAMEERNIEIGFLVERANIYYYVKDHATHESQSKRVILQLMTVTLEIFDTRIIFVTTKLWSRFFTLHCIALH